MKKSRVFFIIITFLLILSIFSFCCGSIRWPKKNVTETNRYSIKIYNRWRVSCKVWLFSMHLHLLLVSRDLETLVSVNEILSLDPCMFVDFNHLVCSNMIYFANIVCDMETILKMKTVWEIKICWKVRRKDVLIEKECSPWMTQHHRVTDATYYLTLENFCW